MQGNEKIWFLKQKQTKLSLLKQEITIPPSELQKMITTHNSDNVESYEDLSGMSL